MVKIYADDWRHPDDRTAYWQHKSAKCAEVLVPNTIQVDFIRKAHVVNEAARVNLPATGFSKPARIHAETIFQVMTMMKVLIGDLFESKAKTIVNTVNCVGMMGKGIARASKITLSRDVQRLRTALAIGVGTAGQTVSLYGYAQHLDHQFPNQETLAFPLTSR